MILCIVFVCCAILLSHLVVSFVHNYASLFASCLFVDSPTEFAPIVFQFIVATEIKHKDLVEALIYAQYPDADITEIEDYAKWAPTHYPHPEYKHRQTANCPHPWCQQQGGNCHLS